MCTYIYIYIYLKCLAYKGIFWNSRNFSGTSCLSFPRLLLKLTQWRLDTD